MSRYFAVVPAAGVGRRMGTAIPKQYLPLHGATVIEHTLALLLERPQIEAVAVAVGQNDPYWPELSCARHPKILTAPGGRERADSVLSALKALSGRAGGEDWVLVHDAARPCLDPDDLTRLLTTLADDPVGGLLAVPVRDTMKRAGPDGRVAATVDRQQLWHAQTPQMFRYALLLEALNSALERGVTVTDEASAIEARGLSPRLVEGRADNLKITCPEDLVLAGFQLARRPAIVATTGEP